MSKYTPPNLFSLKGKVFENSTIHTVYDGDTMRMAVDFDGKPTSFRVRIKGIDTPEIKSNNESEKELALRARDKVREEFNLQKCRVVCYDFDKYGRVLVDIFKGDLNLAELLISLDYAVRYNGGKKIHVWGNKESENVITHGNGD